MVNALAPRHCRLGGSKKKTTLQQRTPAGVEGGRNASPSLGTQRSEPQLANEAEEAARLCALVWRLEILHRARVLAPPRRDTAVESAGEGVGGAVPLLPLHSPPALVFDGRQSQQGESEKDARRNQPPAIEQEELRMLPLLPLLPWAKGAE